MRLPVMRAQQAVTQAVEGARPHAAYIDGQHGSQPREHFLGRLIGKGNSQQAMRRYLSGLDQPGNAGSQYAGFTTARASQNQGGLVWQGDGF